MSTGTRRRSIVVSACLVAALGAGASIWAVVDQPERSSASTTHDQAYTGPTASVDKGDLTDSKVFAGTLGYGAPTGLTGAAQGTLTWLPTPGDVIGRDAPLYAVDERPVRSMHGTIPLWRSLERGLKGGDVRQLNENLAALGYDVGLDETFGPRTQRAVKRWQKARGQETTGVLTANDIAFVAGDVRVASVGLALGQPASGEVLQLTSTKRIVVATVSQREAERLAVGTSVSVRINGAGEPMPGQVTDVTPNTSDDGGAKVDVSVSFDAGDRQLPAAASAQIDAQGTTEQGVLSVPVAALAAGPGGKYSVDVVGKDGTRKRVAVVPGFTADGRVAVTGELSAGDRVVVPS